MPKMRQELKQARIALGLSQPDLAARIKMHRDTVANAEEGGPVRISTARRFAEFYGQPIPDLFPDLLERV